MNTYANEIEPGDVLLSGQTFKVADDSGLNIAGQDYRLDGSHIVQGAFYEGTNWRGVEQTRVLIRPHGAVGLLVPVIMPSARVVQTI